MKKKLQNIKKWIYQKLSKKKTLPQSNQNLKVLIIDDADETITGTLGITPERKNELYAITKTACDQESITNILAEASIHVKHPNELAFVCFLVGHKLGKGEIDPYKGIIRAILRGTQHGED
jgi:hypothetical protein